MMLSMDEMKRLQWRSRRGMLELDVLLEPFTKNVLPTLTPSQQLVYMNLLECEDPDLFSWFMSDRKPKDEALKAMVETVLSHGRYQGAPM